MKKKAQLIVKISPNVRISIQRRITMGMISANNIGSNSDLRICLIEIIAVSSSPNYSIILNRAALI